MQRHVGHEHGTLLEGRYRLAQLRLFTLPVRQTKIEITRGIEQPGLFDQIAIERGQAAHRRRQLHLSLWKLAEAGVDAAKNTMQRRLAYGSRSESFVPPAPRAVAAVQ